MPKSPPYEVPVIGDTSKFRHELDGAGKSTLGFIGKLKAIGAALKVVFSQGFGKGVKALWTAAGGWKTLGKATGAVVRNEAYPQEPGTPAFWNNRPNDLAFEQPTAENTARKRYHVHVWSTPLVTSSGRNVWVANTHFDEGIKLTSALIVPTHMIDPAVDKVRDKVENELVQTGEASSSTIFQNVDPMLGQNEAGDSFFTDGKAYLIFLRPQ